MLLPLAHCSHYNAHLFTFPFSLSPFHFSLPSMTRSLQNLATILFLFFIFSSLVYGASPRDGLHPAHGDPKGNKHQLLNGDWALSAINLDEKTRKYHQFINRAARAIYANDFLVASSYYDSAFLFKNDPYYNDITNSILVNHKVGRKTLTTNRWSSYRTILPLMFLTTAS